MVKHSEISDDNIDSRETNRSEWLLWWFHVSIDGKVL